MHDPLFKKIQSFSVTDAAAAKNYYNFDCWTAHHDSDPWGACNASDAVVMTRLLPAMPDASQTGHVKNLHADKI